VDFESKGRGFKSLRARSLFSACYAERISNLRGRGPEMSLPSFSIVYPPFLYKSRKNPVGVFARPIGIVGNGRGDADHEN
jgi:hypothetical protein